MRNEFYLDVLKPHNPGSDLIARTLMQIEGVDVVRINVDELDQRTASLHIKVGGYDLDLETITQKLEELNCALHSVDEVFYQRDFDNSEEI
ncbi:MAG: hypothetical protein GF311_11820 [Candidatus Lokiarchaeota archaeon]|jgi:hypothetical protein|nr:hypothetical protein [Candidatus Lokiarchaeota archaeon]TXT62526.1 MAG: hypothetical protein BAJALOKI3v1_560024 [Candidatus Lokiarchaeota archaeon]